MASMGTTTECRYRALEFRSIQSFDNPAATLSRLGGIPVIAASSAAAMPFSIVSASVGWVLTGGMTVGSMSGGGMAMGMA
jgi:hypothetical protein